MAQGVVERVAHSGQSVAGLTVGTRVEVRDRFCAAWARGFEIAATTSQGYRLRRVSDSWVLPAEFAPQSVRPARDG